MPTANPLEQLRRRMLSHATPAAFAALAEEHRRAGRLDEAIATCRDGLARYPAYVSARVTLGRALLDSGDVAAAVAELEQAVAQAPDNLAAVRALDAAHAALAELPSPPPLPTPAGMVAPDATPDLALHAPATFDAEAVAAPPLDVEPAATEDTRQPAESLSPPESETAGALAAAFSVGPDGPQEFGLGPDWLPPPDAMPAPSPVAFGDDDSQTQALYAHADAPTMFFRPPPPQDDESAGIWPVPVALEEGAGQDTLAAPTPIDAWDAPATPAEPALAAVAADATPLDTDWESPAAGAESSEARVASHEPSVADDASADPGGNGFWGGLFVEPVSEGAAPAAFAGWDSPGPSVPEPPAWAPTDADEEQSQAAVLWATPAPDPDEPYADSAWEGPAPQLGAFATRADVTSPEAAADAWAAVSDSIDAANADPSPEDVASTPEWEPSSAPMVEHPWVVDAAVSPEPAREAGESEALAASPPPGGDAAGVVSLPASVESAGRADVPLEPTPWAGSVASALDEVFARAGQPVPEEPLPHPSPAVAHAMADAAVEATLEDIADRDDTVPPALASLQQMLDAVRARRAALAARTPDVH